MHATNPSAGRRHSRLLGALVLASAVLLPGCAVLSATGAVVSLGAAAAGAAVSVGAAVAGATAAAVVSTVRSEAPTEGPAEAQSEDAQDSLAP